MLKEYESQIEIGTDPFTKDPIFNVIQHYKFIDGHDPFYAFNRGDLTKIPRVFPGFKVQDDRLSVPAQMPLKIQFPQGKSWRPYQLPALDALLSREDGIVVAPPRSGKTLMLAGAICTERQKTIVFAHQSDLLVQLENTFLEFTNLAFLRKKSREQIVGIPQTWEDFENLEVVLCTKQTFDHPRNRSRLAEIKRMFGAVLIDECHFVPGEVYTQLVNRFPARIRHGVTGTPKRKDGLDVTMEGVLGPIMHRIASATVGRVPLRVTPIHTGLSASSGMFVHALTELAENEARNRLILGWMRKDVEEGRIILAVTDRKQHGIELSKSLQSVGIAADVFNGSHTAPSTRLKILDRVRRGETRVLILMRSMTTGLDIPAADCFYNLLPSANAVSKGESAGEGGYEQQCSRVLTPHPTKTVAFCRDFIDHFGASYACWKQRCKTYDKLGAVVERSAEPPVKKITQSGSAVEF
jgi:superfamily II DNA or RNA helicase